MVIIAVPLNAADGLAAERFERSEALQPFDGFSGGRLESCNGWC
jgi:hypothetical protein